MSELQSKLTQHIGVVTHVVYTLARLASGRNIDNLQVGFGADIATAPIDSYLESEKRKKLLRRWLLHNLISCG